MSFPMNPLGHHASWVRPLVRLAAIGIAAALILIETKSLAVTCAYDSVPSSTLLLPYFRVSRNGVTSTGGDIPALGTDTICNVTNTAGTGVIVKVEVWNKYGKAVMGFNLPMKAHDSFTMSMREVLNGRVKFNPAAQVLSGSTDPCGLNVATGVYSPATGFGATKYVRFANPDSIDASRTVGAPDAGVLVSGVWRARVWDSLDESGDVTSLTSPYGPSILDVDNRACGIPIDSVISGDFSGYVTIDVVNYCTNYFPDEPGYYTNDALATRGWLASGFTPNVLVGDFYYVEPDADGGNSTALPMVALEFDSRLDWLTMKTFYGTAYQYESSTGGVAPSAYRFRGDGREPLGSRYRLRFRSEPGLKSWIIVWRDDLLTNPDLFGDTNLCDWYSNCVGGGPCSGYGFNDTAHKLTVETADLDGNLIAVTLPETFTFLKAQRIEFPTSALNPAGYTAGWVRLSLGGGAVTHQAFVAFVVPSQPGLREGFQAFLENNQFLCSPSIFAVPGNVP